MFSDTYVCTNQFSMPLPLASEFSDTYMCVHTRLFWAFTVRIRVLILIPACVYIPEFSEPLVNVYIRVFWYLHVCTYQSFLSHNLPFVSEFFVYIIVFQPFMVYIIFLIPTCVHIPEPLPFASAFLIPTCVYKRVFWAFTVHIQVFWYLHVCTYQFSKP